MRAVTMAEELALKKGKDFYGHMLLIEKNLIHEPVKSSPGLKDQEIEIVYRFVVKMD